MKTIEHDLHITEKIGSPYIESGLWCQLVKGIVNYHEEMQVVSHRDYDMIVALKVDRLSIQQPVYQSAVIYI